MKVSKEQVRENRMRIVETAFSRHHRDDMGKGGVMLVLGTDAAPIKVGLERQLAVLGNENESTQMSIENVANRQDNGGAAEKAPSIRLLFSALLLPAGFRPGHGDAGDDPILRAGVPHALRWIFTQSLRNPVRRKTPHSIY
nr:hypothetical protein [Serratia entomophila]